MTKDPYRLQLGKGYSNHSVQAINLWGSGEVRRPKQPSRPSLVVKACLDHEQLHSPPRLRTGPHDKALSSSSSQHPLSTISAGQPSAAPGSRRQPPWRRTAAGVTCSAAQGEGAAPFVRAHPSREPRPPRLHSTDQLADHLSPLSPAPHRPAHERAHDIHGVVANGGMDGVGSDGAGDRGRVTWGAARAPGGLGHLPDRCAPGWDCAPSPGRVTPRRSRWGARLACSQYTDGVTAFLPGHCSSPA